MTVERTAGVAGTFPVTFDEAPVGTPTLTIYSDAARTVVAVPTADLAATANPIVWTAAYPATLGPSDYFLDIAAVYTAGQPAKHDTDEVLTLTDPNATAGDGLLAALEARLGRGTLVDPDRARALAALEDVTGLVEGVCTIPSPRPLRVTTVILAAVRRAFDNPSGLQSETVGAYSYSRGGDGERFGAYLTDAERRIIRHACRGTTTPTDTSRRLRARLGDALLHDRYDDDLVRFNDFGQRY